MEYRKAYVIPINFMNNSHRFGNKKNLSTFALLSLRRKIAGLIICTYLKPVARILIHSYISSK